MTTGYQIMQTHIGQNETSDYQEIMNFLASESHNEDIIVNPRKIPWCAAMMNACERAAGNKGTGKLNARAFLDYGTPIKIEDAEPGDICIFARGNDGWSGHVTYFVSYDESTNRMKCLGGNQFNPRTGQSDIVNIEVTAPDRLLGIRRP